jgi:hypothetical protein
MSRTIVMDIFDPASVSAGVRGIQDHIHQYSEKVKRKAYELQKRVADLIAKDASGHYYTSVADDLLDGAVLGGAVVDVVVEDNGNMTLVIVNGKDAVFMEFGAGVYHNGSVGSSPNPWGAALGYTIGSYGKGNGAKTVWGFKDADGELHLTHGVPASMPLYRAVRGVLWYIEEIAQEVFSS